MENNSEEKYWTDRYVNQQTGWDIGYASTPIVSYVNQLKDKNISILIPGAGNAYEAEYLINKGFSNVHVLDISKLPLNHLEERVGVSEHLHLIQGDFFKHEGAYDLIIEQTFFCSFSPTSTLRTAYAQKVSNLLKPRGKLVGLWFDIPLEQTLKRPYGGDRDLYLSFLGPYLDVVTFEKAYNSIKPRAGNEYFGIFRKKS